MVQYHCKALKGGCVPPYVASWAAAGRNEVDPSDLLLGVPRLRETVIFRVQRVAMRLIRAVCSLG
jgi:hypothetical protein